MKESIVYVAPNGATFPTPELCLAYEEWVNSQLPEWARGLEKGDIVEFNCYDGKYRVCIRDIIYLKIDLDHKQWSIRADRTRVLETQGKPVSGSDCEGFGGLFVEPTEVKKVTGPV
jgi:hypothetical protein